MQSAAAERKKDLRRQVREELAALTPEKLERSDSALFSRFLALSQVAAADMIFAFWGIQGREPDTARLIRELLARGKRVCLPRMLPGHRMETRLYDPDKPMVPVAFGILEPGLDCALVDRKDIDLALVPAVCYDRRGYRLGFGGGYYDRWLEGFAGFRVGMCREAVLKEEVPIEAHDSRVNVLVTEEESLSIG